MDNKQLPFEPTIKIKDGCVKIYVNGLIHVCMKHDEIVGFESWIMGNDENNFVIEYYLKSGVEIHTNYSERHRWIAILKLLDENNIINIKI